jgi:DinB superfamily
MAKVARGCRVPFLLFFLMAALQALTAPAWAGEGSGPASQAPQVRPSSQVVGDFVALCESLLVGAADAMPADKYSFAPTEGEFAGVRTFAQQVKHAAATNYILGAAILGEPPPPDAGDEMGPETVRTKPEIMKYLTGSFAYLRKAAAAIDPRNAIVKGSPISPLGGKTTRLGLAIETLAHAMDHYGQMVEYLRMNGVVPPASR